MRKEVWREVKRQFREKLAQRVPEFQAHNHSVSGMDIYRWEIAPGKTFFLALMPSPKAYRDSFMIEIAWSSGEFPETARLQRQTGLDTHINGRLRLPQLWRTLWSGPVEPWWEAGEGLTLENSDHFNSEEETHSRIARVPALVEDAIKKIIEYAVPFVQRTSAIDS